MYRLIPTSIFTSSSASPLILIPLAKPQNGNYFPYWASNLDPAAVISLKAQHPNVKVLASLAGWSINSKEIHWNTPNSTSSWISNAAASLRSIVTEYHLDGIDIDYENFLTNDTSFAYCIGELITSLKQQGVITVATIAPYYKTVDPYIQLFDRHSDMIDYVNHQFYTDRLKHPADYLQDFRLRASQFNASKLLPSYEVGGRGIQGYAFFDALNLIVSRGFSVNGVMIFSADASQNDGFYIERKSQEFLLNSTA